jgi:tetratricopeptide (TPR) repeat protein
MPARRAQDVVHVVMTDHRIQRRAPAGLTAPLAEREAQIDRVEFLDRNDAPQGMLGQLYRAVAVLRATPRDSEAASFVSKHLEATPSIVPRLDLIAAYLQQKQFRAALEAIGALGDAALSDPRLRAWRGTAQIGIGSTDEGLSDLHAATEADPEVPEFQFNYAAVLHRIGRDADALLPLSRALELRPNFVAALVMRAEVLAALGRRGDAIEDLRHALAVDPRQFRAYALIAELSKKK